MEHISLKNRVGAAEWQARLDLAATYRLVAHYGWDDMIFTHISLRVPGEEGRFLINPYGFLFEEITASSLVKIDLDGNKVENSDRKVNPAGFTIHSAIHAARPDAHCVIHLHTADGVAVSAQAQGLLPLDQHAMLVLGDLAYHGYEGVAVDHDERARLASDIADRHFMILRNHGTLVVGATCAEAFMRIYYLERACAMQIKALAGGAKAHLPDVAAIEKTAKRGLAGFGWMSDLAWPGLLRLLERSGADYNI